MEKVNQNKHSETSIISLLDSKYNGNCKYKLANKFIFLWESDFFVLKQNGYSYEFEIKISRSDYFADKKKIEKHSILQTGTYKKTTGKWVFDKESGTRKRIEMTETKEAKFRPNKIFYVVPENLISIDECPPYAGLMYVKSYFIETVKQAPFIHKEKLEYADILCDKFYWNWRESLVKINELNAKVSRLESGKI